MLSPSLDESESDLHMFSPEANKMKQQDKMEVESSNDRKQSHPSTDEEVAVFLDANKKKSGPSSSSMKSKENKQMKSQSKEVNRESSTVNDQANQPFNRFAESSDRKSKYDAFSKAPFIVHFRLTSSDQKIIKQMPLLNIFKKLNAANVKFTQLSKYSRDTWRATFPSKSTANTALSNKLINEVGLSSFIPGFKLSRKVVIKDIPEDFSLTELKEAIEEENSNLVISNLFRLKRRNRTTRRLEDSQTVCIELRGEVLSEKIFVLRTVNPVTPYVSAVRICFRCGCIGHISKYCEKPEACFMLWGSFVLQDVTMPPHETML